jgi:hypothetical protein
LPSDLIAQHFGAATCNVSKSQHSTESRFAQHPPTDVLPH